MSRGHADEGRGGYLRGHGQARMDSEALICRLTERGNEYTIVRPGITACLLYREPALAIGPSIADILEKYVSFIPPGALQTYLSADGTWKSLNKRSYNAIMGRLRGTGA